MGTSRALRAKVRNLSKALAVMAMTGVAEADSAHCVETTADFGYSVNDLPSLGADTGWFPSGSPVQLHVDGKIVGKTTVAMGLKPKACWDTGTMVITAPGDPQTGLLDSEYGADLQVQGKIHANVLFTTFDWQGNVPMPYWIPTNLLMAGTRTFDPTVLPGASESTVSVTSNPTSQIRVLSANVLSQFINIIGIDGDLYVAVQGEVTTSYHTKEINIGNSGILHAAGYCNATPPETGFAGKLERSMSVDGVVHYAPQLILSAHANVTILHIQVVNWTIATVVLPLPGFDRDVKLTGHDLKFKLPSLASPPTSLGFQKGPSQALPLHNAGGAPLVIAMTSGPPGVSAPSITIPPGQHGTLQVTATDPSSLQAAPMLLTTNDPDHPQVSIALEPNQDGVGGGSDGGDGSGSGSGDGSDGGEHDVGGGCNAAHGDIGLVMLVLGFASLRRRARRMKRGELRG
jgi:hypothetical protein